MVEVHLGGYIAKSTSLETVGARIDDDVQRFLTYSSTKEDTHSGCRKLMDEPAAADPLRMVASICFCSAPS